jgi:diphthamide synthase subunit DPH2
MQVEESNTSFSTHESTAWLEHTGLPHKFVIQSPEEMSKYWSEISSMLFSRTKLMVGGSNNDVASYASKS